ncbi:MAG: hypothetical protein V4506_17400 [Bacteroidota bacterium]
MNLKEFLESIQTNCGFLETEGYTLRKVDTSVNRNFWYEKYTETEGYRITFGWTQYGDEFHVKGLHGLKRFNEIEQEIQKVVGSNIMDYYTIHKMPSTDLIPKKLPYESTENNIHFVLKNEIDILLFTDFLKEFYYKECKYFFDKYKNIESVYKDYIKLDREKISTLLYGVNNTIFYRELSLKYNLNSNDKESYYTLVVNELEQLKNNSTFNEILEKFKLIKNNLTKNI